ncbi:MAG: carboxypeptidase regulatory-like domain-containing protein, partial [Bryobacteraceae bacterium]
MRNVAVFLLLLALAVFAQSPLGTVTGLAVDASGSAVPNATITLANTQTGVKRTALTNETGLYNFANLAPGVYKVAAEAAGFRPVETAEFSLAAYRTARQDLRLDVAAAATEITVTSAASEVVQVETPSIGSRLTTRQILELPTNLRSVYNNAGDSGVIFVMMPLTIPGVVQVGAGAKWLVPGSGATGMKLKVDGIETNFGNFGSPDPVSQPSMESIEEFTASVLTNRAEFGGMGNISTVTRAGANRHHAGLFWYWRNSALDARNTFAVTKPFQNIHNYGVAAGGPIKKDKTFYQVTFDGTRGSRNYLFTSNVPTLSQRQGDFSGVATLRNPFTGVEPFDGRRIRPEFLTPQARRAQELFFPIPNFGPPTLTAGNYRASFNGPEVHRIFEIRLDHNFSDRHSAFARYQAKKDDYKIPGARSALPPTSVGTSTNIRRVNFWTVGDVWTPTPHMSNELRAGVVILVSQSDADVKGEALIDQIGIRGLSGRQGVKGVPNMSITGLTPVTQLLLNPVNDGHAQIADNLTWVSGRHTLKFGAEYIHWFVNRYLPTDSNLFGNFSFGGGFTGSPYADFLLGLPTSVTRIDPYSTLYNRWRDVAFYAQDDFKLTRNLTLSYGLRYEFNGPVRANDDNLYSFDLASGSIVIPNEPARRNFSPAFPSTLPVITADRLGLDRSLRKTDTNNWAPRFGFSWRPGAS